MAEAYGRLTKTPGICMVTRGPGACNAAIGVHTAYHEGSPMILFIGQVPVSSLNKNAFQAINPDKVFKSLSKFSATIKSPNQIYEIVEKAINISIDSLDRETFKNVTKHDRLPEILKGIQNLQDLGFDNIKINAVLLNGINASTKDFNAWSEFIKINKVNFRYIELMQTGDNLDYFNKYHISSKIFKSYLNDNNWIYQTQGLDAGPSLNYINPDYKGKFGIIAPYSKDFCKSCNRLRITSKGDLRLCLFGNTGISVRHLLQKDNQTEELKDLILGQMRFKKESHYLELGETGLTKNLSKTGG